MKKLSAILLVLTMLFAIAACGAPEVPDTPENDTVVEDVNTPEAEVETDAPEDAEKPEVSEPEKEEEKAPEVKPEPSKKPTSKPSEKPQQTPEVKPSTPPATTPSAPPVQTPEVKPEPEAPSAGSTVGDTLLSVFRANSSKSAEEIANAVLAHSSIQFMSASAPVSEGLLTGFDNAEIKGFSNGVMFAPAIGTIPFVGYVFELSDGTDADAFIKTLKDNANPRWNICTSAEQTVVEKIGNKVFFLMCPKTFEE